jgi:hypothetical protein
MPSADVQHRGVVADVARLIPPATEERPHEVELAARPERDMSVGGFPRGWHA